MKKLIPENLKGKELLAWLVKNKAQLIATKKSCLKICEPVVCAPVLTAMLKEDGDEVWEKTAYGVEVKGNKASTANVLPVKVVANTAMWMDSGFDVLGETSYDRSIKNRGINIPHIADHEWKSTSHVGDVTAVYTQKLSLRKLGLHRNGQATVLVFETEIRKDYNEKVFNFYKAGKINQHSIGFMYEDIQLAVADVDYKDENKVWKTYIDQIINKDAAEQNGWFWYVPSIKLLENSSVFLGMNELTPTLEMGDPKEFTESTDEVTEEGKSTPQPTPQKSGLMFAQLI